MGRALQGVWTSKWTRNRVEIKLGEQRGVTGKKEKEQYGVQSMGQLETSRQEYGEFASFIYRLTNIASFSPWNPKDLTDSRPLSLSLRIYILDEGPIL